MLPVPYKQQIIPFCAQLDDTAKRYGAVNVVDCKNGGVGYNTDCVGFLRSLEGIPLKGEVLVAGARRRRADVSHQIGPAWRPRDAGGAAKQYRKGFRAAKRNGTGDPRCCGTGGDAGRPAAGGSPLPLADQRHPCGDVPEGGRHAIGPVGSTGAKMCLRRSIIRFRPS